MSRVLVQREQVENAIWKLCHEIYADPPSQKGWESCSEHELWSELVYCILGSRVRSEICSVFFKLLKTKNIINIEELKENPNRTENLIRHELNQAVYEPGISNNGIRYPFPNTKAKYIVDTGVEIYLKSNSSIKNILKSTQNPLEVRDIIVAKCKGVGLKQASLFLRNILFCDNLAIIDSHMIRFIKWFLIPGAEGITNKRYLIYEDILNKYAKSKNVSLASMDLAIWTVMRLTQREFEYVHS